jgi:hypothetical protein
MSIEPQCFYCDEVTKFRCDSIEQSILCKSVKQVPLDYTCPICKIIFKAGVAYSYYCGNNDCPTSGRSV